MLNTILNGVKSRSTSQYLRMGKLYGHIFSIDFYDDLLSYAYAGHLDGSKEFSGCDGTNSTCGVDIDTIKQLVCGISLPCFSLCTIITDKFRFTIFSIIFFFSYSRTAMNYFITFNTMAFTITTAAIYSSVRLFIGRVFVLQSTRHIFSEFRSICADKSIQITTFHSISYTCSDLDWNKLPLTYNKYQGSSKFSFDLYQKFGYQFIVSESLAFHWLSHSIPMFYTSDLSS